MMLLLLVMLGIEWLVPLEPSGLSHRALLRVALEDEAQRAALALRQGGAAALNSELEAFEERTGVQAFWLDARGEEPPETGLTSPLVTPIAREMALQAAQNPSPHEGLWRAAGLSVYSAVKAPTPDAVLVVRFARGAAEARLSSRVWRVFSVVGTASVVCWLLAWHIAAPIESLRGASRRLAGGDLSARVDSQLAARRRDAIGLLARDFDAMAAQLQTLLEAQTRLLADVSHELRTPLARLRLSMALLQRDAPTALTVPHRAQMEAEITALDKLIGELLTLSRLENHAVRAVPFDALECVREVMEALAWEARQRADAPQVRLETEVESATVTGEKALFCRALNNIGRNALRHCASGGTIVFSLHRNASQWQICVSDDGSGVPEAELEAIFQPFYRVEDARDQNEEVNGLGLAIARRAIASHRGTLQARNRQPHGLELLIEVPAPM